VALVATMCEKLGAADLAVIAGAEPVCGVDLCDRCGDCLSCYPGACFEGGQSYPDHRWIVYADQFFGWLDEHPDVELVAVPETAASRSSWV
jgi:hypothetical protein